MKIQGKCYICGEPNMEWTSLSETPRNAKCNCCGATLEESDLIHMLVKYAGGGEHALPEALAYLTDKKILNVDYNGKVQETLGALPLYKNCTDIDEMEDYPENSFDFVISHAYLLDEKKRDKREQIIDRIMTAQGVHLFPWEQEEALPKSEGNSFVWNEHEFSVVAIHKKMSGKAEYTGERFVPGIEDKKLAIEHLQRYKSITGLVEGKRVVDIACGEGYGTAILADKAAEIVGIDIDSGAVKRAQDKYNRTNLSYRVGSVEHIPEEAASVDVIVSFETIEHVSQKLQQAFLRECARVLKPDGILIMSTPNKEIYSDRYNYFNEYHVHEFYYEEFLHFLQQKFAHVKVYNQAFQVVSLLNDCANNEQNLKYFTDEDYESKGKYYIAIASNQPINLPAISSLYMGEEGEYERLIQRILQLQSEEEKRNHHIHNLDEEIANNCARIMELQNGEIERNNHIEALDSEICQLKRERDVLEQTGKTREDHITALEEKNWLLKQYNEILDTRNKILEEKEKQLESEKQLLEDQREALNNEKQRIESEKQTIEGEQCAINNELREENKNLLFEIEQSKRKEQELIQELRNKEGHIELLLEAEREFERYKQTRGYRSTLRRRKIIDYILPPKSKRLFILHVVKRMITNPKLMIHVIRPSAIGNYIKYLRSDSIEEINSRYDELIDIAQGNNNSVQKQLEETGILIETGNSGEAKSIADYETLYFEKQITPVVSIVIPVYNQFDYTYNCLKSILKNSGEVSYEVLIADDCSTDLTRELEKVAKNIQIITTEHNVRFLLNCNNAAKYAKGQYILFLNNDTQVMENWLQPLIDVMEESDNVGMVGSKLVYPDGRLQEAGGIVWKDASAWNYGHLKNPDDPEYVYLKEADYVSGAAIMIRTNVWKEIGGFDERFVPAYYEDTDLAFEVRKHGYKVMMQPRSIVVHYEGISNGTDTSTGLKAYQVANNKKFYEKWKDVLEKEHFDNGQNVYLAKDRGQLKKQILVVDHYVPNYDKDAGGRCTYMYIKMFLKMGLKVTFIGDNFARPEPYTSELNAMGVEILYGNDYYNNWKNWLKDNLHYFDYVYLQRPHISIKYIDIVKKYARGKIFYFAHDLHHVRMYRDYLLTGDEKALEESEKWKKIEMELFDKADVGHVVGSYEQAVMQKVFPDKPIRNIPLYIYDEMPEGIEKDFSKRHDLLFVGGFGHTPNIDAVTWFYENVYGKVLQKYPDMVWHIVGSKAPEEVLKLASDNVIIEGFVSDEDLAKLYKKCRLAVVPLRYGAGVKGKVVEASYYQIPLVTTPIGGEGLDDTVGSFVMEEDADKMAKIICDMYEDFDKLRKMSDAGEKFISTYFTSEVARNVLLQDM